MKAKILVEKEIEISTILVTLPVRYGEEDIPNDFPLRDGDIWKARINVDSGVIENWPQNPRFQQCSLNMKVCDEGTYRLLDVDGKNVASIEQNYVPNGVIHGGYGDYVELNIDGGRITNWPKRPDLSAFFDKEHND